MSLKNKALGAVKAPDRPLPPLLFSAQTTEIRGFRLTLPFPLAYDYSRDQLSGQEPSSPIYAIFDLAGGTVLGRGDVATSCGLDAARIVQFSDARSECVY
jgi:hypothetical protein